jgi:hypothetical protein
MIFQHIGSSVFPFFGDFWQPGEEKKNTEATEGTNGFFWEKLAQVAKL